jgi:uncharacterized membrane protein
MKHKAPPAESRKATAEEGKALGGLAMLAEPDRPPRWQIGARLRNYFLTGLVVVGPVTITIYIAWWFINQVDAWVKPLVPARYNPETYLPFAIPGFGVLFVLLALTLIGALTANLLGRTMVSYGEQFLGRMPIVRNVYRAVKQIFESVVTAAKPNASFQKVGLIQFPSKGIWSLVFVTGETNGEIKAMSPAGESELLSVFMPTGIVPPTGFVSFVPKQDVIFLKMSVEDAAKIIISAGMVMPEQHQSTLRSLAETAKAELAKAEATRLTLASSDGAKQTVKKAAVL